MKRDVLSNIEEIVEIKVINTEIYNIDIKDILKSTIRTYKNNCIGIFARYGEVEKGDYKKSERGLNLGIEYIYPKENYYEIDKVRDNICVDYTNEEFISKVECLLDIIREKFKEYSFSNYIRMYKTIRKIKSEEGLCLKNVDKTYEIEMIISPKRGFSAYSQNFIYCERKFNINEIIDLLEKRIKGNESSCKLTSGNYNFIIDAQVILDILGSSLDIVSLSENRGLFANNVGKVLFNEDVQIGVSRECEMSHTPFFDDEATILENNFIELIARGKIVRGYTDYRTAYIYDSKLTASAQGEFCCKPRASASNMIIKNNNMSLMKLMNGQEVIYIDNIVINNMNSNMKVHGVVENAYEYKEGIFTKRILKFPICFDIMNMLSGDFLGCVRDKLLSNGEYIVFKNIINV